jgi:hypothetical protein
MNIWFRIEVINNTHYVGIEDLIAVDMKGSTSCDISQCNPLIFN